MQASFTSKHKYFKGSVSSLPLSFRAVAHTTATESVQRGDLTHFRHLAAHVRVMGYDQRCPIFDPCPMARTILLAQGVTHEKTKPYP